MRLELLVTVTNTFAAFIDDVITSVNGQNVNILNVCQHKTQACLSIELGGTDINAYTHIFAYVYVCVCLWTYFHILLPPSVNFRISWNHIFNCFAPQSVFWALSFIYALFVNSHHWKNLWTSHFTLQKLPSPFSFLMLFFRFFRQQFTCVCCPFFFPKVFLFSNIGEQSLTPLLSTLLCTSFAMV